MSYAGAWRLVRDVPAGMASMLEAIAARDEWIETHKVTVMYASPGSASTGYWTVRLADGRCLVSGLERCPTWDEAVRTAMERHPTPTPPG